MSCVHYDMLGLEKPMKLQVLVTTLWDMRAKWEQLAIELNISPGTIDVRNNIFILQNLILTFLFRLSN